MGFGAAVKSFFTNYANFSGRASRSEFWWVVLAWTLFGVVVSILGGIERSSGSGPAWADSFVSLISGVVALGVIVPWLSLNWRRFHDIGKSGAFYLIFFGVQVLSGVIATVLVFVALAAALSGVMGTGGGGETAVGAMLGIGFIGFVNLIFSIWYIVLMVKPSDGVNRWGYPGALAGGVVNPYSGQQPYGGQIGAPEHFASQNVPPANPYNPPMPGYDVQQGWERPNPLLNPGGNRQQPQVPPVPPAGQPPYAPQPPSSTPPPPVG